MQQLRLVHSNWLVSQRSVTLSHIKATFTNIIDAVYDVVLEINSHKFMISLKAWVKKLESFEIVAVKGSVELCVKSLHLLKRIVTSLYFDY